MNAPGLFRPSNEAPQVDLSTRHLFTSLARLDLLLRRQVERWRASGQDPADAFRGLYVSDEEAQSLLERPFAGSWGDFSPSGNADFAEALAALKNQVEALSNSASAQGRPARLDRLAALFHLTPFDIDILLLTLAPAFDLRYQRIYGYLQDDITRKSPTVNLALDLFAGKGERFARLEHFDSTAPLFSHDILTLQESNTPLLGRSLAIEPSLARWLLGQYTPEGMLPSAPGPPDPDALPAGLPAYDPAIILSFTGPDHLAQRRAARALSSRCERPLLRLDLPSIPGGDGLLPAIRRTLRDALLLGAIAWFTGWDTALQGHAVRTDVLQLVLPHPDMLITSSVEAWQARDVHRTRRLRQLDFQVPEYGRRLSIWKRALEDHPDVEALGLPHLAGQFALTSGQIRDALEAARDAAHARKAILDAGDLLSAARSHSNPRLGALARKIDPRFTWDDIVLPREQITILREITATVRQRPRVLDEWGVGAKLASSRGVTVLFAGPPGTGKTMAAEIMAHDLGLDLYKIDLSGVVSKYIGETEKNLEKVFEEAASSNAILFFDEADALFGKRSEVRDAHDRYANLEISYLLQRMEAYDGVTILATNLRANLDEAFTRRLQFAVDFPFPEEEDRLRIWKALLPPELPLERPIDFPLLARRFRIAGGSIRNVIVNAAYLAASDGDSVSMGHFLHGTRRELQKMGRLLDEDDLVGGAS